MKKLYVVGISLVALAACVLLASPVLAVGNPQVQTNAATNIQSISAALNGNVYDLGGYGSVTVWFQWGTGTGYGNTTNQTFQNSTGNFSQYISGLTNGQVY